MARKSDGEKIDQLMELTTNLKTQVSQLHKEVDKLYQAHQELAQTVSILQREHEKEIALLKRDVEDLKKWRDERNRRLWAFGPNILGAVISGIIAAIVAYFVAHR